MKKILILATVMAVVFIFTACQGTDVVGEVAKTSFEAVISAVPDKVTSDEEYNAWSLEAPTGEKFLWSKDFSAQGQPDLMLDFDAKPFVDAGLDISKLPTNIYEYDEMMNIIMVYAEIGNQPFEYKGEATPMESFNRIVEKHRDIIGYHEKLDHYGVALGYGNMFEWAKDMSTNDKDIVFILNPQPFIDSGVDPTKVEGWIFTKVEVMDEKGKPIQIDKFLKPFNLK